MENPEFFQGGGGGGGYYNAQFTPEKRLSDAKNADHFAIDDLLDFPNDDALGGGGGGGDATGDGDGDGDGPFDNTTTDSSTVLDNSCNSSFSGNTAEPGHYFTTAAAGGGGGDISACRNFTDAQFSSELCVPYDDLAELEWLSNFVEESFSTEDLQKLHLISGTKAQNNAANNDESEAHEYHHHPEPNRAAASSNTMMFRPEMMSVPAKARSKRSRAAPCNWTSRLLMVAPSSPAAPPPPPTVSSTAAVSSSSESEIGPTVGKKTVKQPGMSSSKKKEVFHNHHNSCGGGGGGGGAMAANSEGRKCLHCATDKTPQWRTGPMGPKTLCNACGVRYKSGRLVPEYRPAASPTFVLTKHSNSHRKVLELRRQKEMVRAQQHQQQFLHHHQNMMFDHVSSNGDDYLIHQHIGPDYRQLI